jgi:hypothetical protein
MPEKTQQMETKKLEEIPAIRTEKLKCRNIGNRFNASRKVKKFGDVLM